MGVQTAPNASPNAVIAILWVETAVALGFVAIRIGFKRAKNGPRRRLSFSDIHDVGATRILALSKRSLLWMGQGLAWDDLFIILSWFLLVVMSAAYTAVIPTIWELLDFATHPADYSGPEIASLLERSTVYLKAQFAIIILFWTQLWLVKAAFMAYYKQLFAGGFTGWQKVAWWWLAVFCILTYVVNWPLQFVACSPLPDYFAVGKCETPRDLEVSNASLYYAAAVDIACDVLIVLLPMSLIQKLTTRTSFERITVAAVFAAALLVVILAVLRLCFTTPGSDTHVDPRWLTIWSISEGAVAVCAAAAPAFAHMFRKHKSSTAASYPSKRRGRSNGDSGHSEATLTSGQRRSLARDGALAVPPVTRPDRKAADEELSPTESPRVAAKKETDKYGYSFG